VLPLYANDFKDNGGLELLNHYQSLTTEWPAKEAAETEKHINKLREKVDSVGETFSTVLGEQLVLRMNYDR
jgi:hypothetical protein